MKIVIPKDIQLRSLSEYPEYRLYLRDSFFIPSLPSQIVFTVFTIYTKIHFCKRKGGPKNEKGVLLVTKILWSSVISVKKGEHSNHILKRANIFLFQTHIRILAYMLVRRVQNTRNNTIPRITCVSQASRSHGFHTSSV